jgi:hypothetical protein
VIGMGGLLLYRSICPPMACRPQRTAATWSVDDMAWSLDQDGVLTQFDEGTKRVKQIDHQRGGRVRFSRQRFQDEAAATAAFDRQKVTFDLWPPLILPKGD